MYSVDKNIQNEIKNRTGECTIEYFVYCRKYSIPFDKRVEHRAHRLYKENGCDDEKKNYYEAEKTERKLDEQMGICSKHKVKLITLNRFVISNKRFYLPCRWCVSDNKIVRG